MGGEGVGRRGAFRKKGVHYCDSTQVRVAESSLSTRFCYWRSHLPGERKFSRAKCSCRDWLLRTQKIRKGKKIYFFSFFGSSATNPGKSTSHEKISGRSANASAGKKTQSKGSSQVAGMALNSMGNCWGSAEVARAKWVCGFLRRLPDDVFTTFSLRLLQGF